MKKVLAFICLLWTVSESMAELTYTHLNSTKTDSNENEWAGKLLDGTGTTKWGQSLSTGDPKWIIFKTSSALIPSVYTLTEANDTPESNGRQWKKWKIYGGNFTTDAAAAAATGSDGWVLLDQKNCPSNSEFPISANKNSYLQTDFTMSQAGGSSYRYFKIVVEEIRQSGEYMQMGDFCFKTYITDPTPQVTFTCTAGKKYNDGEGTEKAFDGVTTTKWNTQGGTDCYALFNASAPIYVWGYDIITANDTEIHGRMPKKWTLYGATSDLARDAEGWVVLSSFSENSYVQQRNFFKQRFFCDKSKVRTAYQYFRLEIDKPEGDMQISEFQLCYETQPVVTYDWKEGYYDSSTTDRDGETMTKNAVDWQLGEKMEGNNLSGSWITIETFDGKSYPVKSYSFSTHDDGNGGRNNRAPKTWKIEGSNDNTNWVTIHEVTDTDAAARNYVKNVNYTTYEFTPTNTSDAFKFIKLTLNSMKGTGWTQLGEFHVVGANYGCDEHNWTPVGTVAATCTTPGGDESICTRCGAKKLENATALASHSYVDGFCSVCGIIESNYMSKNGDYYEASTAQHLQWLATRMDEKEVENFKVKLTQDIDLKDSGFKGFSIGNSGITFKGEFDGQGHWLKNLDISNVAMKQVGLFGKTENASIHDLGMYKANVSLSADNTQNTAIIVGNANKTTINRVAVTGGSKVSGYDHVGSIAGNTQGTTTISNCYSDAEVYSTTHQAGGFVGTSNGLTLEKSIFLGSVKAGSDAGDVGGFISRIETDNSTKVQNNIMAATSITTGKTNITPLCPDRTGTTWTNNRVSATTTFKSTHNDADAELKAGKTMNFDNLNGYQGKTTPVADMQTANFYTSTMGWDMTNDWTFHAEGHYPVLKWMVANISNANELMAFASNVNSGMTDLVGKLTSDIDMSGKTWEPIGNWSNNAAYLGHFDGQGHTITNLSITAGKEFHSLFGVVAKQALIENFTVRGSLNNTGQNNLGVIGYAGTPNGWTVAETNVTIRNIHSYLNITTNANGKRIGGIVGSTHKGKVNIDRCSYSGTFQVTDTENNGNYGGIVGFVETNADSQTNITNCLFDGSITNVAETPGNCTFGGMVGYIGNGPNVTITNCLSVGTVSSTKAGQICGAIKSANSSISSCYYKGSTANSIVENNPSITATSVSDVQVTKGEVAYKMNGDQSNIIWTQTIGTDTNPTPSASPLPTSQQAYQVVANTSYTNLGSKISSDKLQLGTAEELTKFAAEVYAGNSAMNAELTGSINMSGVTYTPIGTDTYKYAGTFNGNGNTISNLSIDQSSTSETGMFSVTNGATIQNIVFDNADVTGGNNTGIAAGKITNSSLVKDIVIKNSEVTSDKQNTGGVVGNASASTIQTCAVINTDVTGYDHVGAFAGNAEEYSTIQDNLSNSDIKSTKYQVAGIVGVLKDATVIRNLFTGSVIGGTNDDAAGLASRIDGADYHVSISKNMIAASSVTGPSVAPIVRDWHLTNVTFEDNYLLDKTTYNGAKGTYTNEDDKNGKQISWIEATTKDFYETTLGWNFTDDWKFTCGGKYPILKIMANEALPTQDLAITAEAGYATMVAKYDYDFTDASFEAFAVTESEKENVVHLEPVTSAKHGEALLLKNENGVNFTQTATGTAQTAATGNLLKASDGSVKGDGSTIYALAKKVNGVGFYPVDASVTIPKGKAYLEVATNTGGGGVKAFYGFEEDDATGISLMEDGRSKMEDGAIYNLAGQRISKMQKGINIVNGKKIAVK